MGYRSLNSLNVGSGFSGDTPPANGMIVEGSVGIGKNNPSSPLDIFTAALYPLSIEGSGGANIKLISTPDTSSFSEILASGSSGIGILTLKATGNSDAANVNLIAAPQVSGDAARVACFLSVTNTTGDVVFQVYNGDGTAGIAAQLSGNSVNPSFACVNGGNFGVGDNAPPSKFTVYENNTTTGTASGVTIEQEGTGDATLQWLLTGGQRYSSYIDNSDSDKWKLDSASTNVMTSTVAGEVTFPNTPAFLAYWNGFESNVTGDGTRYLIEGMDWVEVFDQNSDFSEGLFTAPVSGRYFFQAVIRITNIDVSHTFGRADLSTTSREFYSDVNSPGACMTVDNILQYQVSVLCDLDAADQVLIGILVDNSTKTVGIEGSTPDPYIYFSGFLQC